MFERKVLDLGDYQPHLVAPGVGTWKYQKKLPLTTNGKLRFIALGNGAAFSTKMFQSNFIVVKGQTALFIDLGTKTTLKMAEFGLSVHDIKHLLLTHSHADHIGSVEELALKRRYQAMFMEEKKGDDESFPEYMKRTTALRNSGKYRPKLYLPHFYAQVLWDMSLRGGLAFGEEVELNGPKGEMNIGHFFDVKNMEKVDGFGVDSWIENIGGIKIQIFVTKHIPDTAQIVTDAFHSVGMVIDDRIYISGDTRFSPEITERFGANCELLLHDCQDFPGGVHAFYNELQTLPAELKAKMLLYHLSDGMFNRNVAEDGFLGLLEPAPTVYDFDL